MINTCSPNCPTHTASLTAYMTCSLSSSISLNFLFHIYTKQQYSHILLQVFTLFKTSLRYTLTNPQTCSMSTLTHT
uniref:Uncharacterized protein n=1 Tax=Anguilla anguilla TaxID=7936 RepID=A0A0E9T279_ANGAN